MTVRIDWPLVKAQVESQAPADSGVLIRLPLAGAFLLASILDQLRWEATYRLPGYDFTDWDDLQSLVEETSEGLGRQMIIEDIVAAIEGINAAQQLTITCCDQFDASSGGQIPPVTVGEGDVPQAIIDAGFASGPTDWAGYGNYLCAAAHATIDDSRAQIEALHDVWTQGGIIVGGLVAIAGILAVFTGGLGLVFAAGLFASVVTAYAVFAALTAIVDEAVFDDLLLDIEANRDRLVCAISQASSSVNAKSSIDTIVDVFFLADSLGKTLYKGLNWQTKLRAVFAGGSETEDLAQAIANEYSGATCVCLADTYEYEYTIEDAVETLAAFQLHSSVTRAVEAAANHTPAGTAGLKRTGQVAGANNFLLASDWLIRAGVPLGLQPVMNENFYFRCYYKVPDITFTSFRLLVYYGDTDFDDLGVFTPGAPNVWYVREIGSNPARYGQSPTKIAFRFGGSGAPRIQYADDFFWRMSAQ